MQLPAWNEALGLPRPWDQQWSLRIQQVIAYETDLLEYEDICRRVAGDRAEGGGAAIRGPRRARQGRRPWAARSSRWRTPISSSALVACQRRAPAADRDRRTDRGRRQPVPRARAVAAGRGERGEHPEGRPRGGARADRAAARLPRAAQAATSHRRRCGAFARRRRAATTSCPPRSPAAEAGVTTGEWADVLRGCSASIARRPASRAVASSGGSDGIAAVRAKLAAAVARARHPSSACSSASRASTGTRTAPSRSRCAPRMPASK